MLYEVITVPAFNAVTRPLSLTDATAASELDHVTVSVALVGVNVAVSCCVLLMASVCVAGLSVIAVAGISLFVTVTVSYNFV